MSYYGKVRAKEKEMRVGSEGRGIVRKAVARPQTSSKPKCRARLGRNGDIDEGFQAAYQPERKKRREKNGGCKEREECRNKRSRRMRGTGQASTLARRDTRNRNRSGEICWRTGDGEKGREGLKTGRTTR
ncbi:hypothetical protein C8Q77DRAFT_1077659 [Trametes polyzona]|nr:hypothetical protein C8Q77DRAFT_1077659 [Trametes polyzona]